MLKQSLQLKLSQKLSPQQIQLMKMIQLPTLAFEQRLKEELEENPALEMDQEENFSENDTFESNDTDDFDDDYEQIDTESIDIDAYLSDDETPEYRLQTNNYSDDDEENFMPVAAAAVSFHQDLIMQLNTFMLSDTDYEIAVFLAGSIDDMGYIRRSLPEIVDDLAFTQGIYTTEEEVLRILQIIQQLDPPGVGARDLQECLVLQLKLKTPTQATELALAIIQNHFEAFTKKHYDKLVQKTTASQEQLRIAIAEIEKLNPKPGGAFEGNAKNTEQITPDFILRIIDGELELQLNGRNQPQLHVSREYQTMLQTYKEAHQKTSAQKDAVQFIKQKLDAAKWFIDAIKQRNETLMVTMSAIINYQYAYFLDGDEALLKPMILKDIADSVGLDISTISRVANSKYIDTPYGVKLIKEFFSEGMLNDQGEEVSTIEIKKILTTLIENEDKQKPLPDDKLVDLLKEKGYPIARRTIAKYREQLDIPVARMRKKI